VSAVSAEIEDTFLTIWIASTWLPLAVADDTALSVALRVLLPAYDGSPVTLLQCRWKL
jgi:hypothetical protein